MIKFLRKYWIELLVFGIILGVLLVDCSPSYTWIDTNSDGPHYTYSAKYLYPSHKTSASPYLLLGWLFLKIPFGTDTWNMALISVISGLIGCILIYLIIRNTLNKKIWQNKWSSRTYGLIGALIYGGAALPLSQNIIVEVYPFVTAICLSGYYFALKQKWTWASIMVGLACATHPLALLTAAPMLVAYRELRRWKYLGIMSSFIIFYTYIPLTNREPYMWNVPNSSGILRFTQDMFLTARMLSGGLSIWDLPKRAFDTGLQLLLCWGTGIIALVILFWKAKWYKTILFWLILLPVGYYTTDLAPQTGVYMQPAIAFGAIGIGIGLSKMKKEWMYVTGIFAVSILAYNVNYFDIGRTLDPDLSATRFYKEELPKIPDGQILLAQQGWEWAIVFPYNANEGKSIIPICVGTLPDDTYRKLWLDKYGIKYIVPNEDYNKYHSDTSIRIAKSIIELNQNVWTTEATDDKTYGARIIMGTGNEDVINKTSQAIDVLDSKRGGVWAFRPSNPYDIITGSIEVVEWQYITFSNYNCLFFFILGTIGLIPAWIVYMLVVKRKKWSFEEGKAKLHRMEVI